jgi:peptidoglycan/LPS O-acetylase OafA/YrhL
MWSLRYEAGFYIVISAILFFNKIKYINIFAYIWIILSILRNEFSVPLLSRIPTNLISADYSFFFCLGIFIYIIYHNKEKIQNKTFEKLNYLFLFISFIFSVKFVYTQMENFNSLIFKEVSPTFAVLYFLIIFVLFLISVFPGFLNKNNCIKNILENKSFVNSVSVLGGSSFILYLIHQSVGHRIMYFLGNWTHFQTFSLFILITLFSIFLHVNFEKYLAKKIKNILNKI